jgi:hypothetical protein
VDLKVQRGSVDPAWESLKGALPCGRAKARSEDPVSFEKRLLSDSRVMKRAGANRRHGEQEGNPAGVLKGHAQVWLADWRATSQAGCEKAEGFLHGSVC